MEPPPLSLTQAAEQDNIIAMAYAIAWLNVPGTAAFLNLSQFGKPNCQVGIQAIPPDHDPVYRLVEICPQTSHTIATSASELLMAFLVRKHYQAAKSASLV